MKITKAGAIIYTLNPKPLVLLIKSSNPAFGGTAWQLPKGQIDPGESPDQAGYREAKEEAGLRDSDVVKITDLGTLTLKGMMETYAIHFQAVETHKPKVSGTYHFETGETKWFTVEDAEKLIRKDQKQVLDKLISKLG